MGRIIVVEFLSLDGIVSDPDGSAGTTRGGWAFRHGPDTFAGDKFQLGDTLDTGVMLLGRVTWQLFAGRWPQRTTAFAARMNAVPKLVTSRSGVDVRAWQNSTAVVGGFIDAARAERAHRDVIVTGSLSLVKALQAEDLVDEYRLLVLPTVVGDGEHLFAGTAAPVLLSCRSAERTGAGVLTCYERTGV